MEGFNPQRYRSAPHPDHQKMWWQFHIENPEVYTQLVRLAREAKARGRVKLGIRVLWERMRWYFMVEAVDSAQDEFKMNDHYTAFYARWIMRSEPDLHDFFEIRGWSVDEVWTDAASS